MKPWIINCEHTHISVQCFCLFYEFVHRLLKAVDQSDISFMTQLLILKRGFCTFLLIERYKALADEIGAFKSKGVLVILIDESCQDIV